MLTAEGNEVVDRWEVAALDICTKELAALREAQSIDGGSGTEDLLRT